MVRIRIRAGSGNRMSCRRNISQHLVRVRVRSGLGLGEAISPHLEASAVRVGAAPAARDAVALLEGERVAEAEGRELGGRLPVLAEVEVGEAVQRAQV